MNVAVFSLGLVIFVAGVLAAGYSVSQDKVYFFGAFTETEVTHPYSRLAFPLILVGLAIAILGLASPTVKTITKETYDTPVKKTKIVEKEE